MEKCSVEERGYIVWHNLWYCHNTDDLHSYMPPGTAHFVATVEHCLCVGGHYYSPLTMAKTLLSLVDEACVGSLITNTHHADMLLLLFKFTSFAYLCLSQGHHSDLSKYCEYECANNLQDFNTVLNFQMTWKIIFTWNSWLV